MSKHNFKLNKLSALLIGSGLAVMATNASAAALEEVVVTATKRSQGQSVNDIPMSIQAFSADVLKNTGVSDAASLVQITPGLTFAKSAANTPIFTLRGIGFNTNNMSSTSTVGIYVDELAYAYPYMANGALFDVERVEVLKGPQGTLYGRNTTGGLVNFITNKPSQEFAAGVTAEVGNFQTTNFEGFVNTPISDKAAFRLAARIDQRNDGYQRSVTRDETNGEKDTFAVRASLNWELAEDLQLFVSATHWNDESDSVAPQIVGLNLDIPGFEPAETRALQLDRDWDNDIADWDPNGGIDGDGFATDSDFTSVTARIDYEINDSLKLVSLTGYNEVNRIDDNDQDGSNIEIFFNEADGSIESVSQELRLVGDYDKLHYVLGAYYSNDEIVDNNVGSYDQSSQSLFLRFVPQALLDPTNAFFTPAEYAGGFRLFRLNLQSESTSKAVFGKFDYDISDDLQASFGLRYTDNKLESVSCSADFNGNTLPIWNTAFFALSQGLNPFSPTAAADFAQLGLGPVQRNGCMTFTPDYAGIANPNRTPLEEDNVSGRFSLQYTVNDDWLLFGSISRGYKSGAWPVLTASHSGQLDAATQEKLTAYEFGTKNTLLDGAAQLNAAVFYYDYEDKQLLSEIEDLVFTTLPRLVNIPKSEVYGAEVDFNVQVNENLTARLGVSYTQSEVKEYEGFRRLGDFDDFAGDEFPYTPEWQFTGFLTHDKPLSNGLGLISNLSVSYRSDASAVIGEEPGFDVDGYALVNGDVSLYSTEGGWKVGVYAKNLFDEYYWTSVDTTTDPVYRIPGMPREYGVRLQYNF